MSCASTGAWPPAEAIALTRGAMASMSASLSEASHSLCNVNAFSRPSTMVCFGASTSTSALSPAMRISLTKFGDGAGRRAKNNAARIHNSPMSSQGRCKVLQIGLDFASLTATCFCLASDAATNKKPSPALALGGAQMASVLLRDVRKAFGATEVIHGVDVAIGDGEFVVLVGPSGCGKSTLLRMIAGLENITSGDIRIGDRVVNALPPKERDVAMVFQNYALYPHMTVAANMGFSLKLRGAPKREIETRVARAAEILGLSHLLQRYPRQLSGGQRQRVAMGRAIVRDPQVFLFDEPLSNLDAKLRV